MIPIPEACSRRTTANRFSMSFSLRTAEGSSMIRMRVFRFSAFAISTICCWATDSVPVRVSTDRPTSRLSSSSRARPRTVAQSTRPAFVGRWPRKMFSAIVRSGARLNSW